MRYLFILIVFIFSLSCDESDNPVSRSPLPPDLFPDQNNSPIVWLTKIEQENNYPTIVSTITEAERNSIYSDLPSIIKHCITLDKYGYPSGDLSSCRSFSSGIRDSFGPINSYHRMVRNQLYELNTISNIENPDILIPSSTSNFISGLGYKINYKNQVFEDLEVIGTSIQARISPEGVYWFYGNWFNEIHIPDEDSVDIDTAIESLIGFQYTISCHRNFNYTFVDTDIILPPLKVIYPLEIDDRIGLYVAHRIKVELLEYYIDTYSGKLLGVRQTSSC